MRHPLLAIPPLLLAGGAWLAIGTTSWPHHVAPAGAPPGTGWTDPGPPVWNRASAQRGSGIWAILPGSVLAILCQSQGPLAQPLAIILLAVLFAAMRREPWSQGLALILLSNGLTLAVSLLFQNEMHPPSLLPLALLPLGCLLLPVAAGLTMAGVARHRTAPANWTGWIDIAASVLVFAATCLVRLDPLASVFAPLLALDGILRSCRRRRRSVLSLDARAFALLSNISAVAAVCVPGPIGAGLVIPLAIMAHGSAPFARSSEKTVSGFFGAGILLFGLLILTAAPLVLGYASVFIGCVMIAACVPDLAVVVVIIILRLANHAAWPDRAETIGISVALLALLACAARLLITRSGASLSTTWCSPVTLLQSSQAAIAALAICGGGADGRFAGLVLLALVILVRAAARDTDRTVVTLARAGLGGVPLGGVFPGLVLVVLAEASHDPWLLLPLGAALLPILAAGLPDGLPRLTLAIAVPSIGWLALSLAVLVGYFAPEGLIRWCHTLTAGP